MPCSEADRLGIALAVNVTSGWNPGGPYITPELALKKLTWSETDVAGGRRVELELPQPPTWYMYEDVRVQAVKKAPEGTPMRDEAIRTVGQGVFQRTGFPGDVSA